MAHQSTHSNMGSRNLYESDDQKKYSASEVLAVGATHGVNTAGHSM